MDATQYSETKATQPDAKVVGGVSVTTSWHELTATPAALEVLTSTPAETWLRPWESGGSGALEALRSQHAAKQQDPCTCCDNRRVGCGGQCNQSHSVHYGCAALATLDIRHAGARVCFGPSVCQVCLLSAMWN